MVSRESKTKLNNANYLLFVKHCSFPVNYNSAGLLGSDTVYCSVELMSQAWSLSKPWNVYKEKTGQEPQQIR